MVEYQEDQEKQQKNELNITARPLQKKQEQLKLLKTSIETGRASLQEMKHLWPAVKDYQQQIAILQRKPINKMQPLACQI